LVRAVSSSVIDSTAYIRRLGGFIPVTISDGTLEPGTLPITTQTTSIDILSFPEFLANETNPQWQFGSKAFVAINGDSNVGGGFYGYGYFDGNNKAVCRNLLNLSSSQTSFFGRIDYSGVHNEFRFFTNHGKSTNSWGAHPVYENGFTASNLVTINEVFGNTLNLVSIQSANYQVVNDIVTIYASITMETKFNQGVGGREALVFFPLPFPNNENGGGHGSLRFFSLNNHQNIGVLVEQQDTFMCVASAKWSSVISSFTDVIMNFSFSYKTDSTI
jgi:hypothetical protein